MSHQPITIRDDSTGAEATIAPQLGSNCYQFRVPSTRDEQDENWLDIFWSHPDFAAGSQRPSGSGVPILFPYPGRLQGMVFEWRGKSYKQESNDKFGNAIHGFVHKRPWRIIDSTSNSLQTEFHAAKDDPSLLDRWPADFRIKCRFEIVGQTLKTSFRVENPCDRDLPFGLGAHPYFRLPLIAHSTADECVVSVPVKRQWELDEMLPTGASQILVNGLTSADGLRFADMQYDDVFSDFATSGRRCEATIRDKDRTIRLSYSQNFRTCVLFTPPHREAVCIEPYTCIPDAQRLRESGIGEGMLVLSPGESFEAFVEYGVELGVK